MSSAPSFMSYFYRFIMSTYQLNLYVLLGLSSFIFIGSLYAFNRAFNQPNATDEWTTMFLCIASGIGSFIMICMVILLDSEERKRLSIPSYTIRMDDLPKLPIDEPLFDKTENNCI